MSSSLSSSVRSSLERTVTLLTEAADLLLIAGLEVKAHGRSSAVLHAMHGLALVLVSTLSHQLELRVEPVAVDTRPTQPGGVA